MNESTFVPPLQNRDPEIAAFFRSADGRIHGLRVETFGGLSWKTEFSVMTGIPSGCYGPFGTHVFHWAAEHVHHSLPQCLARHGYRSAIVYPTVKEFVGAADFYASVGIDTILDRTALGVGGDWAPDAFYFDRALDWLDGHVATDGGPAFLFVATMSNHYPHDAAFDGTVGMPPRGAIADTEFDEYMRRLRRTCRDHAAFRAALAQRFPDRRFLVVHFGDHQPPFAARMIGHAAQWDLVPDHFPRQDSAYRTYFAVDGVGCSPRIDADLPDPLEASYLGTVLLDAAGLPLDAVHRVRRDLMMRHDGRLFFALPGGRVAAQLNRRMLDQGLISPH